MKPILLFIILSCCLSEAYSQKIMFADPRNSWSDYSFNADGDVWHPLYFYHGDTLIGDYSYRLMYQRYPIREDTTLGIVYIFYKNADRILYNYNLQVGDTISYAWNQEEPRIDSVIGLDSFLSGGLYYKVFSMVGRGALITDSSQRYRYTTFEGIGSPGGPLQPLGVYNFEGGENLVCFEQDTMKPKIQVGNFINCYNLGLKIVAGLVNITEVAPNPAKTNSRIILPYIFSRGTLIITNSFGQIVKSISIENAKELTIGDTRLPGIYFYKVIDSATGATFSGKFVFEQ